ncbi:kinetochore protein NDC80 homolog [Dendronephthya gigantea]|uniref:kinetochore protein NDC80 homolog n=1 Tax=Dendronephthya gigantea TaxID=151771 RepID=UPI00106D2FA0|nr:kinetochore protein NDC80 homolog [Dendronephthya gigantea]
MRRATLGTMNIGNKTRIPTKEKGAVRSRSSLGLGGRFSNSGPRTSGARPKTSFGSSRRSSQYGRGDPYTQIKDTRPLSDKSYQQQEIREILQFLSENDYEHPMSMKTMMRPTNKEFINVFSFLYSRISPEPMVKPEEELPKVMKKIGYQFTIHKTSLSNVASPHAWPILLGALHWLLELVKFSMAVNDEVEHCLFPMIEGEDDEGDFAAMRKVYFDFLERSYSAFIEDKRDLRDLGEYTDALIEELRSQNDPLTSEVEQLSQENIQLEEELKRLENEPSRLEALMEKRGTLETDKSKFEVYIADLRRHRVKLDERRLQSEEALNTAKLEEEATSAEKTKLQRILANQELSAADVQRMKQEGDELKKTLTKLEETSDSMDQEIWEKEMSYARRHEQVLVQCQDYNERARKLKLIPSTAENAAGVDYELRCHLGRMTLDIKNQLKPSLLRFKQQIAECSCRCESELINLKEKHDVLQEQISEKEEAIAVFEEKIVVLEKEIQWRKQQYDEQHNKLSCEVEELQNKIDRLRMESQISVSDKRRHLEEAKERLKTKTVEMEHQRRQYELFLSTVCELVIEHKTILQERVIEIRKGVEEITETIKKLPPLTSKLLSKADIDRMLPGGENEGNLKKTEEGSLDEAVAQSEEKPKQEMND